MSRIVFRGANLLDGEGPARPETTVIVENERILRVSDQAVEARDSDRLIELAGRTLMPGLISSHFHSTYDGITLMPQPLGLEHPPGYMMLLAANNARRALECGFTSVISAGAISDDIDAQLKLAIDNGVVPGPRLMAGSRGFDTTGGYTDTASGWWQLANPGAARFCDGPDGFRKGVREELARGAEIIKLFASGGHGVADAVTASPISEPEVRAAAETAHQRGFKVRAHCAWRHTLLECVGAGVDVIDHGDGMDTECLDAMLEAGTFLVPGLYFVKKLLEDTGNFMGATPAQTESVRAEFENAQRMLPVAQKAGLPICVGDDYGVMNLPHGSYAEELEFYVEDVGIAPLEVIRWATRNGAELMGRADELGTVAEGKLADLLVVDGDPSHDIAVLQHSEAFHAILKGGEFVKDVL
ncbi:amidohydrolase family protein [Myxococcota bacterium]|nr:amidohydrolase family protein [Myxococcota bacterium]